MPPRVLVAHSDANVSRLVREALEGFCVCEVEVTSSAVSAFERAMQRPYALFIFDIHLPLLTGSLLYELISKAYLHCHAGARTTPAVIYFCQETDLRRQEEWLRDARVKGLLTPPIKIGNLLARVAGTLETRPEMSGPPSPERSS